MNTQSIQQAPPEVWVLSSYRAGENSQLTALAEALGLPFEVKSMSYRNTASRLGLMRRVDNSGIDPANSAPLRAPWPRLVITAGLRNEPLARWIGRQSGGTSKLVFIGRSWAQPDCFDLLVTTPQYRVPEHPRVIHNSTTMQAISAARLVSDAQRQGPRLAHLPAPRIAVMVGGNSGPHRFGKRAALALAHSAGALASTMGGSLLVSTSARTPKDAIEVLAQNLRVPHELFTWKPSDPHNPYFAYLGLADRVVVTSDSIAMLSEACASGKTIDIFDIGGRHPVGGEFLFRPDRSLNSLAYSAMMLGPKRLTRDLGLVHQQLIDTGRAQWLGDPPARQPPPPLDDVTRTVARVRALLGDPAAPQASAADRE